MSPAPHYGKVQETDKWCSIVMDYADNGDVFQKICEHQSAGSFMKEKIIWKILI
jgi:hypothetical protein